MTNPLTSQRRGLPKFTSLFLLLFLLSACSNLSVLRDDNTTENNPIVQAKASDDYMPSDVEASTASNWPNSVSAPEEIRISEIGVKAKIIKLGLNADQTLEVPKNYSQAGWWTGGSHPGEVGPAVIVGHLDSKIGPAVFYGLQQLQQGHEIQILDTAGHMTVFKVDQLIQVSKDQFPTKVVYGQTDRPTLRLVTCGGSFNQWTGHYRDNIIVFASLAHL